MTLTPYRKPARAGSLKKPRSKRQEHYQIHFELADPKHARPEVRKQARQERREWKRLHSKEGRRLDKKIIAQGHDDT